MTEERRPRSRTFDVEEILDLSRPKRPMIKPACPGDRPLPSIRLPPSGARYGAGSSLFSTSAPAVSALEKRLAKIDMNASNLEGVAEEDEGDMDDSDEDDEDEDDLVIDDEGADIIKGEDDLARDFGTNFDFREGKARGKIPNRKGAESPSKRTAHGPTSSMGNLIASLKTDIPRNWTPAASKVNVDNKPIPHTITASPLLTSAFSKLKAGDLCALEPLPAVHEEGGS